jgi:uncharacterized protein DUF4232
MVGSGNHGFRASIHRRRIRPVLLLVTSAAFTSGLCAFDASAVSASSPRATSASATPQCMRAQLRLNFVRRLGATSHRFIDYAFMNAGTSNCSLRGYPHVVLVNKSGVGMHRRRAMVGDDPVSPVRTVVIKPGKRAFFTFTWAVAGACPGHTFTFYAVRVTPPGDHKNFERHLSKTSACDRSARVTAVRPKLSTF